MDESLRINPMQRLPNILRIKYKKNETLVTA